MNYDQIKSTFENSVTLKLLRSPHAPMILFFLHHQFKKTNRFSITGIELKEQLSSCLDDFQAIAPNAYPKSAQAYLDTWCDRQHGFLRKYYEENNDDPLFELTPGTEKALEWLGELETREFIGTESRFLQIFELLKEIAEKSSHNPQLRLAQLEAQKAELEKEIEAIREAGQVVVFKPTQIRERFYLANDEARKLLADFKQVEHNFRHISRKVQETYYQGQTTKGAVLEDVLNFSDELKNSDQGQSFYAFRNFLLSQSKQKQLEDLLETLYQLDAVESVSINYDALKNFKLNLCKARDKVAKSIHYLSGQLRKLLDERYLLENRRVGELVNEIKGLAFQHVVPNTETTKHFFYMEQLPEITLPLERPLWKPSQEMRFERYIQLDNEVELTTSERKHLFEQSLVDPLELKRRIRSLLRQHSQVTLSEVVASYPIENGLSEILGYFIVASKDARHVIHEMHQITLMIPESARHHTPMREMTLPQIIFTR